MTTLILSAGSIASKYQAYTFLFKSPALIPIATRSAVSCILDFYEPQGAEIYLAVNADDIPLLQEELQYYAHLHFIPIRDSKGVCDSLRQSLAAIENDGDIVVNIVTTIPTQLPALNTALLADEADISSAYSGVKFGQGEGAEFHFKTTVAAEPFHAFTGLFRADKGAISKALEAIEHQTDLLEVVKHLHEAEGLKFELSNWIDIGHEINYASARKKMVSSRSFNSIQVDEELGILTKRSKHKIKLANETKYVAMLPTGLQILYPRILSGAGSENGEVAMEYYGYPNLAEYQLYRDIPDMHWARIFHSLEYVLRRMKEHSFSIGKGAFVEFYFDKTAGRIADYKSQLGADDPIFKDGVLINGQPCRSFDVLESRLRARIDAMYDTAVFGIMHGDYCFNNILYDVFSGTLKLIDPRGSFGDKCVGIYGDVNYDIAKLLHSSVGHYDYIVNNLFLIKEAAEGGYNYSFPLRQNQAVLDKLSAKLITALGLSERDIYLIVGLLFLSMCALHADNADRQRLMYLHGLQFLNKNL